MRAGFSSEAFPREFLCLIRLDTNGHVIVRLTYTGGHRVFYLFPNTDDRHRIRAISQEERFCFRKPSPQLPWTSSPTFSSARLFSGV
ncbi:hypothetical protein MLD38_014336 [Melastoma candidum]|uniref:Uncharacterized protein n=1 Tax=Melastoma candidum TaxID=119954 RepID=A0ACB9RCE2_9MYRT|nr:hypothetical protein MLD38_014336 [Melastoma candidum]